MRNRFPTALADLLRVKRRLYGVWVKLAHKSLVWYRPDLLPGGPPGYWTEFVGTARDLGARALAGKGPAPLSMGAADGWVLTDWFENVLAGTSTPKFYTGLASSAADWTAEPVRHALRRLADLWGLPGAFPGGGPRALLTQYDESVIQVSARRRAAMVVEGDFVEKLDRDSGTGSEPLQAVRFPTDQPGQAAPLVVGGDAAVVLGGSAAGYDFVRWLVDADFGPWIDAGGFLSPQTAVLPERYPDDPDDLRRRLAGEIRSADDLRFDLSDLLPAPFTGSDGVGIWRIMQDFFAAVARRPHDRAPVDRRTVDQAVERTVRRLARAAAEAEEPS